MATRAQTPINTAASTRRAANPVFVLLAAWLVPGLGHVLLGRWIRGVLLCISILAMFALGLSMHGKVYTANTSDPLDMLGFVGDLGVGGLYLLARLAGWGDVVVQVVTADYGTKFIVVAGLLNVIAAVDANSIATGRKP